MPGLEKSENQIRYRVREPNLFIEDSMRTKEIDAEKGISIIIGKLKDGDDSMVTQAYRFDGEKWTMAEAEKWLRDHGEWKESDNARGEGQGVGGERQGDGGASECFCPACGYAAKHDRGTPCNEMKCPECGAAMKGKSEHAAALFKFSGLPIAAVRDKMREAGIKRGAVLFAQRGDDVFVYKKKDKLETIDIPRVEAFRSGKWTDSHGKTTDYSDDDIAAMATEYNRLERIGCFEAPVKLGHDPAQPITDGMPALGWLRNAVAEGGRLFFDLCGVPKKIAELIKAGAYKKRSMEILHNFEDEETGNAIKHMPAGLALLGASLPALGSLDEIAAAYGTTEKVSAYSTDEAGLQTPDTDDKKKEGESSMAMTPEEQKLLDDLKAENDALKKEIESLKAEMAKAAADHTAAATENADFKAKLADLEGKYAALTDKAKTADEENFKAKFSRKVTPADMELLVLPRYREIRDAGKTEDMSAFTKALTERKDHTMLSEHSRNDAGGPHAKGGKDYDALVKERCEKLGKDYKKLSASEYAAELREVGYVYEKPPMLDAEDDKGGSD